MNFNGIKFKETSEQEWNGKLYHDYVFAVDGEAQTELFDYFREQSMACIGDIRYGVEDGLIGVELIFPFNKVTATANLPHGLKEYLDNLILTMKA